MGFYVRFDDIRKINETTAQQISKWQKELVGLQSAMKKVINLKSFQGQAADSVKTYYNEIHNLLLSAMGSVMVDYMSKVMLYGNGYYNIDGDIHTKLKEDTLNKALKEYDTSLENIHDAQRTLRSALDTISDIYYSNVPPVGTLEYYHEAAMQKTITVRDQVWPYENRIINNELKNLRELIENTISYIREYKNGTRNIMINYSSGDYIKDDNIYNLVISMNKVQEYQIMHQKNLEEAINQQEKVYKQLQAEYEAEMERLAKERADQGGAQILMGIGAVVIGAGAIIFSAGTATPVVVAGTSFVLGTSSALYGVSEVAEGSQDVYHGAIKGDPYTESWNPIRDTFFLGKQNVYNVWGGLSTSLAGLCIPAGTAMKGLKGVEAIKAGTKAAIKYQLVETGSGFVADMSSEAITTFIDVDSETVKTLLSMGIEQGLEKGIYHIQMNKEISQIKADAEASGKGLGGLMDEAEAARYESYWLEQEINQIKADVEAGGNGFAGLMDEADAIRYNEFMDKHVIADDAPVKVDKKTNILSSEDAEDLAFHAIKGKKNADIVVIGKFEGGSPNSYNEIAKNIDAQYYELDAWDDLNEQYSKEEIWKINEKFLDIQTSSGREIYLTHNPQDYIGDGTYYSRELQYLIDNGYSFVKEGDLWHAVRKNGLS